VKKNTIRIKKFNKRLINDNYLSWFSDREINKYTDQYFFKHSISSLKNYLENINRSKVNFLYSIEVLNDKKFIHVGNIKLGPINFLHQHSQISYLIGNKKFWGLGIATYSLKRMIKIAKKEFKIKKLIAGSNSMNSASIKVLEKSGFIREGVQISYGKYKNKRFDNYIFGLIT